MDLKSFVESVKAKQTKIGIIGLGYVGLPLMLTCVKKGFKVIGFDVDRSKCVSLNRGNSYINHIPGAEIDSAVQRKMFFATSDFEHAAECDTLLICVPTPLNRNREPYMEHVIASAEAIAPPCGKLVVLESTTWPGTTDELVKPILERAGNIAGEHFFLAFSPEREDPGNKKFSTHTIPKVVGGYTPQCTAAAVALYSAILNKVVPVSSTRTAEMTKILENMFRSVNIALVNEAKILSDQMGINIWEAIDAAATKPFGYMPFYPGPGLGGHCIPVDPFYLTWKAREYGLTTKFIELAGEINTSMHHFVLDKVTHALNMHHKAVRGSNILIIGVAYKADIDDIRESPSLAIIEGLIKQGATVHYHDPFVPSVQIGRNKVHSLALQPETLATIDVTVVVTKHSQIAYNTVLEHSKLIVDCRNAYGHIKDFTNRGKIIPA